VNDHATPSALRELRIHMTRPLTLALLATVALVLMLMGAFGTGRSLSALPRLAYWASIVGPTYAIGYLIAAHVRVRLGGRASDAAVVAGSALATAIGVTLTVAAINAVLFGDWMGEDGAVAALSRNFAIAALVSVAVHLVQMRIARTSAAVPDSSVAPALLGRMPLEKRGALVALSAEDHYVRVRTTKGEDMILMRLSDAIGETAPTPGLRVHRSHWVATAAVRSARREGDRAILSLSHGEDVPVSRLHVKALKDAGLLPG